MSIRLNLPRTIIAGAVAAAAAAAAITLAGAGSAAAQTDPPASQVRTITVTGEGTVNVAPDTAVLNIGVEARGTTGAEAMGQLNVLSQALTDALVAAGIAADDLQTSGLNLYSTYGDDGSTITGYSASVQVTATIRDIDAVGSTIDAAQQAVGEGLTLGGVSFSFSDPESVLGPARTDAVANAAVKAQQFADAAGVTLGDIVSIVEGMSSSPILYAAAMADAAAAGPAISAGSLDLTASVTVTYVIG